MSKWIYTSELIENIKAHLDNETSHFITCPKFVFLCGKNIELQEYEKSNRGTIQKTLAAKSKNVFFVLSEKLWEDDFDSNIDLLTFEDFLAEVSDSIILLVESPGSFCELGAFAYTGKLFNDKLIIIIDEKYKDDKSFIMSGPVAKAKKDGAKIVFAPLEGALLSSTELRNALSELVNQLSSKTASINKKTPNTENSKVLISVFVLEILELIKLLQPISRKKLIEIYKDVKGFSSFNFVKRNGDNYDSEIQVDYIIKLLKNAELVTENENGLEYIQDELQPLMLKYNKKTETKERLRLYCKRYRYEGEQK